MLHTYSSLYQAWPLAHGNNNRWLCRSRGREHRHRDDSRHKSDRHDSHRRRSLESEPETAVTEAADAGTVPEEDQKEKVNPELQVKSTECCCLCYALFVCCSLTSWCRVGTRRQHVFACVRHGVLGPESYG